nr:hypothetical protein [Tanacetum cinerariifolium]
MASLVDKAILSGADNHPPMLEKDMYDFWKSRIELYMLNRQHDRMILESVEHGPLLWPTIGDNGVIRLKKYSELSTAEAIQADCHVKETNIILQALPPDIYALVSTHKVAKDLWERIQMLMQGTSLTKQERECKLYDEFDKFAYRKGETICDFYLRPSSSTHSISYPVTDTSSLVNHNAYMASSSAPQLDYAPMVQHSSEYLPPENGLVVLVFQKGDDPIDAINHMMSFLTAVVTSRRRSWNFYQIHEHQSHQAIKLSSPTMRLIKRMTWMLMIQTLMNSTLQRLPSWQTCHTTALIIWQSQTLYDGRIIEKSDAVVIPDTEETLMLGEESRSKMIEKQNDPQMTEKKVITKPINYAILNQLLTYFKTQFVPQIELSAEYAFWSQYLVQTDEPTLSATTTIVEVPKELPKVSMVNSCLKKLKSYLASFDMVVKERTTVTAITKGTWGFEHTKACFCDDIIPFVKALKELFTSFDQCLIDEVTEVQNVFKQMELGVEQHREEKHKFKNKMENVLQENDRLFTQALSVEILNVVVHDNVKSTCLDVDVCAHCVTIESEHKKIFSKGML